jgi:hypothetical protein
MDIIDNFVRPPNPDTGKRNSRNTRTAAKKRANALQCGTLTAPDSLKEAFQGHCLFFRGILLLHICTFQVEHAITDVDIKAKLAPRGTAAARKELMDWRRSQAGTWSWRAELKGRARTQGLWRRRFLLASKANIGQHNY